MVWELWNSICQWKQPTQGCMSSKSSTFPNASFDISFWGNAWQEVGEHPQQLDQVEDQATSRTTLIHGRFTYAIWTYDVHNGDLGWERRAQRIWAHKENGEEDIGGVKIKIP